MSLLPLNSTQLERAIEAAIDHNPVVPIRTLYNAKNLPGALAAPVGVGVVGGPLGQPLERAGQARSH